jgi:penicillin-binding protein 1A
VVAIVPTVVAITPSVVAGSPTVVAITSSVVAVTASAVAGTPSKVAAAPTSVAGRPFAALKGAMAMSAERRAIWSERWEDSRRPLAYLLALLYGTVLFLAFAWSRCFFTTCPNVKSLVVFQPGGAPLLLDRNGEVFADLAPAEREVVPLASLPAYVPQAFLAVEDKRFYEHRGLDWTRVGGALLANLRSGEFAQGFSTISMQLARNVFPDAIPGQEQTTRRKLLEMRVAQQIEQRYSKEEILELYLNNIYFGNRARGIEAAARQYFARPARELTLPQAALLAALLKAPSTYDPRRHPDKALERRNLVLTLMREQKRIPRLMSEDALRSRLELAPAPRQVQVESGLAPYFVEQVRRELEERFGSTLYSQPLRIVTTLDSAAQRAAEEELRRQLKRVEDGEMGLFEGTRYSLVSEAPQDGTPYLQGALVMLDARNGDVLAWVGGRDYAHSQFDRVAQARRQPGSAFKPFVYAAALAHGWALSQPLLDQPLQVRMPSGQIWRPRNFTDRYEGRITLRDALVRSKNVATVRLASAVGLGDIAELARDAGIDEPISPVPSLALGSVTVSPLELTSAYTGFATLGQAVEPRLLLRIEDEKGKVLWRSQPERHKVLDPAVAYLVTNVLADALVRGTGNLVQQTGLQVPAAGKTGTTNEGTDAWFVGYTPEIAAGVWIGFDENRPIMEEATGGRLAAPVWGRVMARVYQRRPKPQPWKAPAEVVSRPVDPATGLVIAKDCAGGNAQRELFIEGLVPASYCPGREAPPRNGFPAQQQMAEREARDEEAERQERLAEQRRKEEQERLARTAEARDQEAERQRREREEEAKREAVAQQKAREKEQEKARIAEARRQDQEERKQAREQAEKKERAEFQARRERLAKAEAVADQREKEIVAREKALREKKPERKEEKEERTAKVREKEPERKDEERIAKVLDEERRAREDEEEEARSQRESARKKEDRDDQDVERARTEERDDESEDRDREEHTATADLSGWWEMTNTIQSTNYESYKGLRLSYRVQLEQEGDRIVGRGQKWSEDGHSLSSSARTPITVTGTVDGRKVTLQFTERGAKRTTTGGFSWTLSPDRTTLRGTFWSTAADTSGSSLARRMP